MFVTSSTVVPGMLGGIEGGDSECQRLADNVGLPGTYMAWLSTGGINARDRVGEGGWMRTDGRPFTIRSRASGTRVPHGLLPAARRRSRQ